MKKYRIVTDSFGGYDVQKKVLFFFWKTQTFIGFDTIERAEDWINDTIKRNQRKKELEKRAGKIVKYL